MATGVTLLVILMVPLLFQVILLGIKQKKRYEDLVLRLTRIENKLNS